ncbi:uncharacterized protein LOC133300798 [Gastrolobium bilobum]|uniref:uncharacterized protein LOC133300798 n=1 Tax=Gastrolobium bilobum TaxID=150636 RepID=UPI002AB0797B|nr:uncharacterized protein LOC133300798 [Gastrolobium bilobum]
MEGLSHLIGLMQPYHEAMEDRETIDRRLNATALDKIFRVTQCTNPQKLMFATYMLEGDVHKWWMNTSQVYEMQGHVITWPFFEMFLGRYFMYDAQERKQGEFERLVQSSMSVDEYLAKFNELAKFAHFKIAMPTPAFLASKFRRGLNEEIADRIAGAASRDFGTLIEQCRDIEDVCVVSNAKKAKVFEVKGAGSSTYWRDRKLGRRGKGKQLSTRQTPNQFKRTSTHGSAARPAITTRCTGCGRSHVGPCATGQIICFHYGKEGHYARDCPSSAVRTAAF